MKLGFSTGSLYAATALAVCAFLSVNPALATDVAPHWVGGFVDWGKERVVADVGDDFIDVGNWYARFFRQLLQVVYNLL